MSTLAREGRRDDRRRRRARDRRQGQLRRADALSRCAQRHAHRAGRDFRPGAHRDPVRRRGRGAARSPTTCATASPATSGPATSAAPTAWRSAGGRHDLDQLGERAPPADAVRRHEGLRHRPRRRRLFASTSTWRPRTSRSPRQPQDAEDRGVSRSDCRDDMPSHPVFNPPFNVVRAAMSCSASRDLGASRAFYVDCLGLHRRGRGQGRALSARHGGAQPPFARAAQARTTSAVPRARLQGRQRGGPRPRRRLLQRRKGCRPRSSRCRSRAARCARCDPRGMPLEFYFRMDQAERMLQQYAAYKGARIRSASTISTASRRTCRPPSTSTPSSASA